MNDVAMQMEPCTATLFSNSKSGSLEKVTGRRGECGGGVEAEAAGTCSMFHPEYRWDMEHVPKSELFF